MHQIASKETLTILAKLNNKMDSTAKRIALEHIHSNTVHQTKPTTLGIGTILCGGCIGHITCLTQFV